MADNEQDRRDVDLLLDADEGLTEWEIDFAENLGRRIAQGGTLTERQRQTLHKILDRLGL